MENCGLNGGIPWFFNTDAAYSFSVQGEYGRWQSFLFNCSEVEDNPESVWPNLKAKNYASNTMDRCEIVNFFHSLDRQINGSLVTGEASASPLIKQLPLSLPDSYPMLFLKFTALDWKDCMSCRHHGFLIDLNLYQSLYAWFVKLAFFAFFLPKLPLVVLHYFL